MIDPEEFLRSQPAVISAGTDADKADSGNGAVSRDASERRGRRYAKRRGRTGARRDAGSADRDEAAGTGPDGGDELKDCFDSAVASLNAADATEGMLRDRLARKEYSQEAIDRVVVRLTHAGLLDDERFAQDLLQRCLRRSMGPAGVRREFLRRRISADLTDECIGQAQADGSFDEAARRFVESFGPQARRLDRQTALRRLASRASSRGLSLGIVRRYAAEILNL